MRPYKRSKERYAVQVRNLTTYADSMGEALKVGEAMQSAAYRRGEVSRHTGQRIYPVSTITPLGAHQEHRPRKQGEVYGDLDLCEYITGLSDDPMADYLTATDIPDTGWPPLDDELPYTVEDHAAAWLGMRRGYSSEQH